MPPLPPLPDLTPDDIINTDLLELMGATGLKDEDKGKLYQKMLDTIQLRVANRISDALTDEEYTRWKELPQADKQRFLEDKGVDIGKIYLEETVLYKTEMANLARAAQSSTATPATA